MVIRSDMIMFVRSICRKLVIFFKVRACDSFLVFEPGEQLCPTRAKGRGLGVSCRGLSDDPWEWRRIRDSPHPNWRPDGPRAGAGAVKSVIQGRISGRAWT